MSIFWSLSVCAWSWHCSKSQGSAEWKLIPLYYYLLADTCQHAPLPTLLCKLNCVANFHSLPYLVPSFDPIS